jgi:MarR family transcriptional regulator, transcriptional regulator for hemolysin
MTQDFANKPPETLGFVVNDVARLIRKLFEQMAKGSGLTRAQWQVLAYLRRNDGIRQGALAEILELEPISLSRVVDKLEAAGFVERRPDEKDRRSKRLHLKPGAHPVLEDMMRIAAACRGEALQGIADRDVAELMQTLQKMRANLSRVCGSEAPERDAEADGAQGQHKQHAKRVETIDG